MRLRELVPPLRYAVYVAGALLALFLAFGVGATATLLVARGQSDSTQTVQGGSPGPETLEGTATEATATDAFEGTSIGSADGTQGTNDEAQSTNIEQPAEGVSYVHIATDENSRGDYTYLSDPAIDGDPNAVVLVEHVPDRGRAGGEAYAHNIGVWYEQGANKWAIFNQDRAAVPAGTAFRVAVPRESEGFVERLTSAPSGTYSTYLDHPLLNGNPEAVFSVTQNWNPGGVGGVYNDHPVGVGYDTERGRWFLLNTDFAPMKEGAAFNVGVSDSDEGAR